MSLPAPSAPPPDTAAYDQIADKIKEITDLTTLLESKNNKLSPREAKEGYELL